MLVNLSFKEKYSERIKTYINVLDCSSYFFYFIELLSLDLLSDDFDIQKKSFQLTAQFEDYLNFALKDPLPSHVSFLSQPMFYVEHPAPPMHIYHWMCLFISSSTFYI